MLPEPFAIRDRRDPSMIFGLARRMMESMARGGGMPGLPGAPGMGIGKRSKARQAPQAKKGKGKRVSGNPAKRAQQAQQSEEKPAANPFGIDQQGDAPELDPADFQLPAGLDKYLK